MVFIYAPNRHSYFLSTFLPPKDTMHVQEPACNLVVYFKQWICDQSQALHLKLDTMRFFFKLLLQFCSF